MTSTVHTAESLVDRARGLRDIVMAEAAESERLRTLSPRVVEAMWDSGLMTAFNPAVAGGAEPSFAEMIETWIEMAWQDGSFGWVGIANLPSSFAAACYLPDTGFAEVFTAHDNRVTMGGQFFPNGQGAAVPGGYRLTGAWNFGSGIGHSQYVAAGFLPMDGTEMRWAGEGVPDMRVAILPREQVSFDDGWFVQGLKGTGSYDYSVTDVFVPEERTFALFTRSPLRGTSPATRMGLMPVTAAGHASWALGVAKSMLDDVEELAATKVRMSDMASLASRPTFQKGLAHHVAAWRAARLLVLDAFGAAEAHVAAGQELTPMLRADMRAAAVYATDVSRQCAEWAHLVAGTSAIREGSRLERAFRDMYTGTQHAFISEKVAIDAASIRLGLIDDQFGL
ncbi:acyl-CoA dehydrogenase type 2 [Mycolicibacterium phlei]|jgi:alkylation response protein AidB-like acyl-CoA dehydrogenase|uniref:Acyl-CoA dehydrogenase n=1 Tax=Mycolicibacterium phlei DSM 43239 = CCUG 21000 TaxID=1226750 RepID=A0A5N5UTQ5_MYCPH|nr:acyl-CoA dehydrogenase family protein [Mycolicibacterium phlei]VEG09418.1 acyl-CoA dehydrogenase type 2 [Mycobacteroides chelonae]AMO61304.1 Flavin-dependent monooxygenase, oxygenase subunit HsaA [Mycolicibacterium phlei]EID14120.1 acyl-CoA dehydrogenase [Mycolicibacterium phlei RIVM601174]KAB7752457.1 acyl-CoA dehydrogenase [Mycolicibacterium phlei DSM 43239 = CCUG 21000]KXW60805.1 acyl-CoA dehydrogenase [Mycolicibacterium phlei DSM 43239 = CCUG 21000]